MVAVGVRGAAGLALAVPAHAGVGAVAAGGALQTRLVHATRHVLGAVAVLGAAVGALRLAHEVQCALRVEPGAVRLLEALHAPLRRRQAVRLLLAAAVQVVLAA